MKATPFCLLCLAAAALAEPSIRAESADTVLPAQQSFRKLAAAKPTAKPAAKPAAKKPAPAPAKKPAAKKKCTKHGDCNAKTEYCDKTGCSKCHTCSGANSIDKKCPKNCDTAIGAHCKTHKECKGEQFCSAIKGREHKCIACNFCHTKKDSVDGFCPPHCIPPNGAACDAHAKCGLTTQFCAKKSKKCTPCQFCDKGADSIDNKCPAHCIPAVNTKCDTHHHCQPTTEFCTSDKHPTHKKVCLGCQWCSKNEYAMDKKCPKHCRPALGSTCDQHAHCDQTSEFCDAKKKICMACQFCQKNADSIDKKCPMHCRPPVNSHCNAHAHCDPSSEFCSKGGNCRPCQYCQQRKNSLDGRCPRHCIPPLSTHCDGHHHCDATSEFCSKLKGHMNQCVSCNYCQSNKDAIDGRCPKHCMPPAGANCDAHHHCDPETEFCAADKIDEVTAFTGEFYGHTCVPCQYCQDSSFSIDKHCPTSCMPAIGTDCDQHHHCDPESEFCASSAVQIKGVNGAVAKNYANSCLPCQFCSLNKYSIDKRCPLHCIPPLNSDCNAHEHCDMESEFCSAQPGHKNQCVSCNYCRLSKDSITGRCPKHCIPPLGAGCDKHHHCDPDSEFCSIIPDHEYECVSCNYCQKNTDAIDGKCPEHCTTPVLAPCDGHHHCDATSEFCAANPLYKNRCVGCQWCEKGSESIDGKCPKHCIPPGGSSCDGHHHCDPNSEFCSIMEGHEHECVSCQYCHKNTFAVDRKCPVHCIPQDGVACDHHHHCDLRTQFCSGREGHKNQCVSCNYCRSNADSIDHKCPKHCIPKIGASCDAHAHCDMNTEYCSAQNGHKNKCVACQFCHKNTDSIDHKCPAHCVPKIGTYCDGHHHCDGQSEFCAGKGHMKNKCVPCNFCTREMSIDKKCPHSCIPPSGSRCNGHHHCGTGQLGAAREFCSAINKHTHVCLPCQFCHKGKDSIDHKCPAHCIPPVGSRCDHHAHCDPLTEFCAKQGAFGASPYFDNAYQNSCVPCQFCTQGKLSVDKRCPKHCVPHEGAHCDGHHHCDRTSQFCSNMPSHKNQCVACNYCQNDKDSIDKKCPAHCEPQLGSHCDGHHHCDGETEFCSNKPHTKNKCLTCAYCRHGTDSVDGKCPQHCITRIGSHCDGHHHCDPELEFCSAIKAHANECVPCQFCHVASNAIGGACPKHCMLKLTIYGNSCAGHHHCAKSAFCSMIPSFEMKCLPCGLCLKDSDAMEKKCPASCKSHQADVQKVLSQVQAGTLSHKSPEYQAVMRLKEQSQRWEHMLKREKKKEEGEMGEMWLVTIISVGVSALAVAMLCAYRSRMKGMIDAAVNSIVEENEKRRMREQSEQVELSGLTSAEGTAAGGDLDEEYNPPGFGQVDRDDF